MALLDEKVNIKIKLAGIWASVMFCFVYGDYMGLYVPNTVSDIILGKMVGLGQVTPYSLIGTSGMMILCSLMPFLSIFLIAKFSRLVNIICASLYIIVMLLTMFIGAFDAWDIYYWLFGVIEILLMTIALKIAYIWPQKSIRKK